jgi:hypothetical protein
MQSANTPQWTIFETSFESQRDYDNPYTDADVRVMFTSPSGQTHLRDAFWDSGRTWRVRAMPSEVGTWQWHTTCSDATNAGLHDQRGTFACVPYVGDNRLYTHGALRVSANKRFFEHADGTPFFWLGDTCWNGVLRATPEDWDEYLTTRKQQGFNVVQYISTTWRGLAKDPLGETSFIGGDRNRINVGFFQRIDPRVDDINAHGFLLAPILVHDNGSEGTDGNLAASMTDAQTIRLARYLLARWGAHHGAFTLGGDGRYDTEGTARWQRIGRAVFADQPHLLATMHPCGVNWMNDTLNNEAWLNFVVYQSGHYGSPDEIRWLSHGPPATEWRREPHRPFINAEPNYEAHAPFRFKFPIMLLTEPFTDHDVRRVMYWSLLVAPTAGATYGHQYIWPWNDKPTAAEGHDDLNYGILPAWRDGVFAPGARSMTVLRHVFDSMAWWKLTPAPDMVLNQIDTPQNPLPFVAAASAADGSFALIYTPQGRALHIDTSRMQQPVTARWFDPRTGETTNIAIDPSAREMTFVPPTIDANDDANDWLLWLTTTSE